MMLMELELSWVQKPNGKLCPVDNAVLVIAPIPAGLLDTPFSIMRLAALFAIFFFAFGVFAGVGLAHEKSREMFPDNKPTQLDPILEVPEDSEQPGPGPNPQLDPQAVNVSRSISRSEHTYHQASKGYRPCKLSRSSIDPASLRTGT